jgi:DNA-directed RNA polymerase subunit M/transcription elongation factor TFIIS
MTICPSCGSADTVALDSRRLSDGLRRRVRRSCRACSTRWTLVVPIKDPGRACEACHSLSASVLESRVTKGDRRRVRQKCRDCGHRWTVWILADGSVSNAAQRQSTQRPRLTCLDCDRWQGETADHPCWFRFPDPIEEGIGFAADCLQFRQREELQQPCCA